MMGRYFAHSGRETDLSDGQPLDQHLNAVATLAAELADRFGAAEMARLSGLLHDLGKYTAEFQQRLCGGRKVDHATAGAKAVLALREAPSTLRWIIAYGIAGHHAGLPDQDRLADRLDDPKIVEPDPVWRQEIAPEGRAIVPKLTWAGKDDKGLQGFQLAFLGRMVFACLIEADRRDTARFDRWMKHLPEPEPWPRLPAILDGLLDRFDTYMSCFEPDGAVNTLRERILGHVLGKAALAPGLFTLTVPTGGGKTLASCSAQNPVAVLARTDGSAFGPLKRSSKAH